MKIPKIEKNEKEMICDNKVKTVKQTDKKKKQ